MIIFYTILNILNNFVLQMQEILCLVVRYQLIHIVIDWCSPQVELWPFLKDCYTIAYNIQHRATYQVKGNAEVIADNMKHGRLFGYTKLSDRCHFILILMNRKFKLRSSQFIAGLCIHGIPIKTI